MPDTSKPLARHCLVTVGATVGFKKLVEQVLQPEFWRFLCDQGFTSLHVQCGPDINWAKQQLTDLHTSLLANLEVTVFDVTQNLMLDEMILCRSHKDLRSRGVVITHAGTGTILDGWKIGVYMIVVPNESLLDNHQLELAKHLAVEGYATRATASREDIQEAILKSNLLFEDDQSRWPPYRTDGPRKEAMRLWHIQATDAGEADATQPMETEDQDSIQSMQTDEDSTQPIEADEEASIQPSEGGDTIMADY